jgi:serine/threonine-protein kinase HipA
VCHETVQDSDGVGTENKIALPDEFEHWIVKFPATSDPSDAGAIEYAYSLMAVAAGIDMPPTRLFATSAGESFFGVRRFDRQGNRRFHIHTFGNLIQADFRIPSADYADLLKATSLMTRNHQDVLRALRRMVFNVLAHNRDDHVKNFAFLLDDATGEWSLSPAYDLLYAPGPGGEHSMTLAGEGRAPGRSQVHQLADQAAVSGREADRIIEEVHAAVAGWKRHATRAGISAGTVREIARRLPRLG